MSNVDSRVIMTELPKHRDFVPSNSRKLSMSLSSSTLAAIQKTGAAAFHAQARLKKDEKAFAAKIQESMGSNAYSRVNDLMFEHWKAIARMTQTLAGMEAELKKIYAIASELAVD